MKKFLKIINSFKLMENLLKMKRNFLKFMRKLLKIINNFLKNSEETFSKKKNVPILDRLNEKVMRELL